MCVCLYEYKYKYKCVFVVHKLWLIPASLVHFKHGYEVGIEEWV